MTDNVFLSHVRNLEVTNDGNIKNGVLHNQEKERKFLKLHAESTRNNIPFTSILNCQNNANILLSAYQHEIATIRIGADHITSIEKLKQYLRMCVKLKIKETKDVYEGEVVEINSNNNALTLKSLKGSKTLKFSASLLSTIQNENISVGDIIYVECNSGIIKRLGKSESCMQDNDLESEKYLSVPKGELLVKREVTQVCTLHDLDFASMNPNTGKYGMILNSLNIKNTNISDKLRCDNDDVVNKFVKLGKCELELNTLIIDHCSRLSIDYVVFLDFYTKCNLRPSVLLVCEDEKWIEMNAMYLKNFFVVNISNESCAEVIKYKIKEAGIDIDDEAVQYICEMGGNKGMQYAVQFIQLLTDESERVTIDKVHEIEQALG